LVVWGLRASAVRGLRRFFWRRARRYAYELCHACGRPVARGTGPAWWSAPDDLWYEVRGSENGVRCMACFTAEALAKGVQVYWRPVVDARRDLSGRWVELKR
jgi:hypothetical protein